MRKILFTGAATAALALGVIAAPAAQAYDREAFAYAAGHMPASKSIPKALGTYHPGINFMASYFGTEIILCFKSDRLVGAKGAKFSFNAFYRNTKRSDDRSASVNVYQFPKATNAIKAFDAVKKSAKECTGTDDTSFTAEDGVVFSNSVTLTNGTVPSVTVTGVESIFVNADFENSSSDDANRNTSDTYTVFTLVNNVIIATTLSNNAQSRLTAAERRAVNQFAFNNVDAWLG